ncbi:MAG TPA: ribonuclease III [Candidatus Aphodoplasma excrementigallinarum]|uniref:Mini-ribonuclease 3 n=1 Tax=Candidatus Aphodoplasma excrementigallinarum TaxID=2840673 RepID=A0A9D1SZF9_9FIRM|nr:ribonuclease III [Candidatus Aphodoplasma excrementigallinarum]
MPYIPDETVPQPGQYGPLALAFVGDGVYELYVRTRLMRAGSLQANKLHRLATQYVKAGAQAASVRAILDKLSEEEGAVYRRGRNAKSATVPKNADVAEYRMATGFEALLGYLYLSGRAERLREIMELACGAVEEAQRD